MQWIQQFDLFLFDFDGLLVDTESIHFLAYQKLCLKRGFSLDWTYKRFSDAAHHSSSGLRDQLYLDFPQLYKDEPDWRVLHQEKQSIFLELLKSQKIRLMDGALELLTALEAASIRRCVVTHSPNSLVDSIRCQVPILQSIPFWITREDYHHPKPDSECYKKAIEWLSRPQDRIIGFEDSPKGLTALKGTSALPVLICPPNSYYLKHCLGENQLYFPSLAAVQF